MFSCAATSHWLVTDTAGPMFSVSPSLCSTFVMGLFLLLLFIAWYFDDWSTYIQFEI